MRLYLAPMRGLTDSVYRNTYSRYFPGIDLAIAPFITTVQGNKIKPAHIRGLLPEQNQSMPVIPQILSNNPEKFIDLARYLTDMGYADVNWNLGCPFPMVANKKRGCGLLPHPEQVDVFLDKVVPSICARLSIKTRLGRYDADEIDRLMPVFNRYPLSEIIIHPRTGAQMYTGQTDLCRFEKCVKMSNHPIVYNGDIQSRENFEGLSARFGQLSGWMIGRGVLANPFLPGIIKQGSDACSEKIPILIRFHDELFDQYQHILSGPSHAVQKMKGLWAYLSLSFPDSAKALKKIYRANDIGRYHAGVEEFFSTTVFGG